MRHVLHTCEVQGSDGIDAVSYSVVVAGIVEHWHCDRLDAVSYSVVAAGIVEHWHCDRLDAVSYSVVAAGIVEHWHCDRLGDRSKFRALLAAGGHFDAIIDFVAFGPNAISDGEMLQRFQHCGS